MNKIHLGISKLKLFKFWFEISLTEICNFIHNDVDFLLCCRLS